MKILLAPAETKKEGGEFPPYSKVDFYFQDFKDTREEIVSHYERFLKESSLEILSHWFGLKKISEVEKYQQPLEKKPTIKAIQRYTGVAFEALDYENLSLEQQKYCDENVVLFSNLFGPLKADDLIPDYKFKQGAILPNIDLINHYKSAIKESLDNYLGDEIIDLRAGFYDKFYKPSAPTITFKFLKEGKVVSHWAKHYRGQIVKELAKNNIKSFEELMNFSIENLSIVEIKEQKNKKEITYNILV